MEKIEHSIVATNGINLHVASIGTGPAILFLHGFPDLWYTWRHQLLSLSARGYRAIAPDLRGYGESDAPKDWRSYTALHAVGDLAGLLDGLGIDKVFLVGHDWGAMIAWWFCLIRPDRVKALVNTSVPFVPRHPTRKTVEGLRAMFGDDYYICRFQEPGEIEEDFAQVDTKKLMARFLSSRSPRPLIIPKNIGFKGLRDPRGLPSWLTDKDLEYYAEKFNQKGFTGGLSYYRAMDLTWELTAAWTDVQVKVPVKYIVGDLDLVYHIPGTKEFVHNGGFKRYVPFLQDVVVMEGVGHFLQQEKPEEVSDSIYDFFKKFGVLGVQSKL